MRKFLAAILCTGAFVPDPNAQAAMDDDPLLWMIMADRVEWRDADDGSRLASEIDVWFGRSLHKIWLKSELERTDGETEGGNLELLYSRAISAYWDVQLGVRRNFQPQPQRHWAVLGINGLAPYFFHIDAALYLGESGRAFARAEFEYDLLLTQKLILSPRVEFDVYNKKDSDTGIGSGLSTLTAGLRLRYEIKPQLAPYIGLHWEKKYGDTADFSRAVGEETDDLQLVIGMRAWF